MTLAMLYIERARTRMPQVCTVISLIVLAVFVALSTVSWLIETNASTPDFQGAKSMHVPQTNTSATNVSAAEPPDPYGTEPWVVHGREF